MFQIFLSILSLMTAGVAIFCDWLVIRPSKGKGLIIPEYEPPKDLNPIQVGLLCNPTELNRQLFVSEIFFLSTLGYIKITKSNGDFILNKVKEPGSELKNFDVELMKYIFAYKDNVDIKDLRFISNQGATALPQDKMEGLKEAIKIYESIKEDPNNKGKAFLDMKANPSIYQGMVKIVQMTGDENESLGYTDHYIKSRRGIWVLIAFILFFFSAFVGIWLWPASIALFIYGIKKSERTKKGAEMMEYLKGYKEYLETVEKERLEFTDSPEKFSKKFSKIFPYAIILNVNTDWLNQFSSFFNNPLDKR